MSITDIDAGKLVVQADEKIMEAIADFRDQKKPQDKPRKVNIELEFVRTDEYRIGVLYSITTKLPPERKGMDVIEFEEDPQMEIFDNEIGEVSSLNRSGELMR